MMRQRTYIDGKLDRTTKPVEATIARRWLDNIERQWSAHISPLTQPGEFDPNNAHKVTRASHDELIIITTGNKTLRFVNIVVK